MKPFSTTLGGLPANFQSKGKSRFYKKALLRFLIVLLLAGLGCSPKLQVRITTPIHTFDKGFVLGVPQEAEMGTTILSITSSYSLPSFKIKKAYHPRKLPSITPDQKWVAFHSLNGNYVLTTKKYPYNKIFGLEVTPDGELGTNDPWIELHKNSRPVQSKWETTISQVFIPSGNYTLHEGFFKSELIYSGITGSTIHVSHREFSNYLTRPALIEELCYDLSKSDLITFKSIKIKVTMADNEKIRYQVIDDAGLIWVPRPKIPKKH